ncbi:hypothetical protein pkur_cds_337 [Pandoravirus kuranda]|uniref:Uncharacterized protein n=1 Tax=Pandoravirus kuranda TaxID=3019033 RepID=A0AA95ED09_9VIRU|nr:hypothetical protein pkur_cds_337 [Pandoravirus kuranda]
MTLSQRRTDCAVKKTRRRPYWLNGRLVRDRQTLATMDFGPIQCIDTTTRYVELRYSGDVDIVVVYTTRAAPGLIAESVPLDYDEADLFMDVDDQNRVVAIEFLDASQIFACHFFDDVLTLDDKEPLCMGCSYGASSDELLLSFVETRRLGQKEHRLETDVIALVDARNRITGIRFTRASEVICRVD